MVLDRINWIIRIVWKDILTILLILSEKTVASPTQLFAQHRLLNASSCGGDWLNTIMSLFGALDSYIGRA